MPVTTRQAARQQDPPPASAIPEPAAPPDEQKTELSAADQRKHTDRKRKGAARWSILCRAGSDLNTGEPRGRKPDADDETWCLQQQWAMFYEECDRVQAGRKRAEGEQQEPARETLRQQAAAKLDRAIHPKVPDVIEIPEEALTRQRASAAMREFGAKHGVTVPDPSAVSM